MAMSVCLCIVCHCFPVTGDRMEMLGQRPHTSQAQKYLLSDLHREKQAYQWLLWTLDIHRCHISCFSYSGGLQKV